MQQTLKIFVIVYWDLMTRETMVKGTAARLNQIRLTKWLKPKKNANRGVTNDDKVILYFFHSVGFSLTNNDKIEQNSFFFLDLRPTGIHSRNHFNLKLHWNLQWSAEIQDFLLQIFSAEILVFVI